MLPWGQEKSPIDEGVTIKNGQNAIAQYARHFVEFVAGQIGQDEDTRLVVANATFVLHFDVIGIDFLLGQNIEGAVVHTTNKNTSTRVMPIKEKNDDFAAFFCFRFRT